MHDTQPKPNNALYPGGEPYSPFAGAFVVCSWASAGAGTAFATPGSDSG